jgi:hypothetical protein
VFFEIPTVMAVYSVPQLWSHRITLLSLAIAVSALSDTVTAQDPVIQRLETVNLRPGEHTSVSVIGTQLSGAMALWTPVGTLRPKAGHDPAAEQLVVFEGDVAATAVPGTYPVRMITNHGCSEAAFAVVDDLPTVAVTAEAEDRKSGQLIALPCSISSSLNPVLSKFFRISMTAGQTTTAEILARRLGSDLDPVLRVTGPDGKEIAYRDDLPGAEGDTQLQFTAPADGEYRLEVRDVRYSGGPRHFFHLRLGRLPLVTSTTPVIAQAGQQVSLIDTTGSVIGAASHSPLLPGTEPDAIGSLLPVSFRAANTDASSFANVVLTSQLTIHETEPNNAREEASPIAPETQVLTGVLQQKGDSDWFRITASEAAPLLVIARTREVGSPTDIMLELFNADGGKISESDDSGARDAELAASLPAAGDFYLRVSEIAGRGGPEWTYALDVFKGRKAVRVTAPVDRINVPRGGSAAMQLTVRRIQYDGPLKVEAVGLPAALQMAPFWVNNKQAAVPVVLTAADPMATSSDADWGSVRFRISAPDEAGVPPAELQLAPPPPKKQDAEIFRSARLRTDLFAAVSPPAQFSFTVDPATVTVAPGATATVLVKSTRAAEWTMPIEIALATPPDQLPAGITVTAGPMPAGELAITITAAADAPVGPFSVFLQGKAKKDNAEPIHPVPAIHVEVKN